MPVTLSRDGAGVSSIVAGMAEGEAAEGTITLSFRLRSAGNSSLSAETGSVVLTWCTGLFDLPYTAQGSRVEDSLHTVLYSKTSTILHYVYQEVAESQLSLILCHFSFPESKMLRY